MGLVLKPRNFQVLETTSLHCRLSTHTPVTRLRLNMAWSRPGKRPGFPTLDGSPKGEVSLNTQAGTRRSNGSDGLEFKSDWGIITTLQRLDQTLAWRSESQVSG